MKHLIIFLFIINGAANLKAQDVTPIYFYGETITTDRNRATSYGIYGKLSTEDLWVFKRFDLYDNLIQTGAYKDERLTTPHGKFYFYMDLELFNQLHVTNFKLKGKTRFLCQQGTFVDGLENGKWLLFYPDGTVLNAQDFVNGKLHGQFVTYDKYGNIEIKGNYVDGERDGEWLFEFGAQKAIYEKGVLKSSVMVEKPKKEKKKSNKSAVVLDRKSEQNQRASVKGIKTPDPTRTHLEYMTIAAYNEKFETAYQLTTGNKFVHVKGEFVNGYEEGKWSTFYPDGKINCEENFIKGKLHGAWKTFYQNGKLKDEKNYVNGNLDGGSTSYDEQGNIKIKGNYIAGKMDGTWIFDDGKKEIVYAKGQVKTIRLDN